MLFRKSLLLLALLAVDVHADVPPAQRAEVQHLLDFVRATDCMLERNDSMYSGVEAVEHILKKYDYYREDIHTSEDFIDYSASKSMLSGRSYSVHCNNSEPVSTRDWLLQELARYRKSVRPD